MPPEPQQVAFAMVRLPTAQALTMLAGVELPAALA
jgi:hypothetical protein